MIKSVVLASKMDKTDKDRRKLNPKNKQKKSSDDKEIEKLTLTYSNSDPSFADINSFEDMPLSARTLKGLKEHNYITPTQIQKESIIAALHGSDVLGSAKTGSGKTLAFLVPILDILYCKKWTNLDGVGAIIITPTRELALQIYETLVKIGKYHDLSAALVIGGKDLEFERNRINQVNIIICTPGRLLQHMNQNCFFAAINMQILVLDEADRCLHQGFQDTIDAILADLPERKQTLLFSATQTSSVEALARLNLNDPWVISVDQDEEFKTPNGLKQTYLKCAHHEKMTFIWSFIKSHPKQKIIIFLSTCNQVKFFTDVFKKLRPSQTLFCLQGKIHQMKRIDIYHAFRRKQNAILFATDIAARGLDFPSVDWVVQGDCPENVDGYIHRVGRTARYNGRGESLLLIDPSEMRMIEKLKLNRIPIFEIFINKCYMSRPQTLLELHLVKENELKTCAQRAFVSYFKSVFLMKDKTVFDVKSIDPHLFARSLGLIAAPRVRFIQRKEKKLSISNHHDGSDNETMNEKQKAKLQKLQNEDRDFNFLDDDFGDGEECTFAVKRKNHELTEEVNDLIESREYSNLAESQAKEKPIVTKAKVAKRILKRNVLPNKKIVFDEEGEAVLNPLTQKVSEEGMNFELNEDVGISVPDAQRAMIEEDKHDRKYYAELSKARRREKKLKEKGRIKKEREENASGSESSDGSGPDLSWLPDPDIVYKNEKEDTSEEESKRERKKKLKGKSKVKRKIEVEDTGSESSVGPGTASCLPRTDSVFTRTAEDNSKSESEAIVSKRKLPSDFGSDSEDDLGLSLGDQEDLALKLISFKK